MRRAVLATVLAVIVSALLTCGAPAAASPDERPDRSAVADLVADLGAAEAHVRDQARDRLVKIGAAVAPDLAAALDGANVRARVEAARALGAIGAGAKSAVAALEKAAGSADPALADAAKQALQAIATPAAAAPAVRVPDLIPLLASKDVEAKRTAIRRLGDARGADAPAAADALALVLGDADLSVRAEALRSLGSIGAGASGVAPQVVDALASNHFGVRSAALDAAARIGAAAVPAEIKALAKFHETQSDETGVRPWIESALWDAGAAAVAGPGRVALGMEDPHLAAAGADALGAVRATDAESVAALVAACAGRPALVRRRAAAALGMLGGAAAETSTDALVALLADQGGRAQVEAAEALRRVLVDLGERPARPSKVPADVQKSIDWGLDWLAAHQDEDGRWDCAGFDKHDPAGDRSGGGGEAAYDAGVASLALVAFIRSGTAGRTGESATWNDAALRRGLRWLVSVQDAEGGIGPRGSGHFIYTHAISTLALCEASRRTGNPLWTAPAQRALDFLAAWRNPEGCWRYERQAKDTDTSVNGWCVQALSAGTRAGLRADRAGDAFVLRWLDAATQKETGIAGYYANDKFNSARTDAMGKRFPSEKTASMTASACLQRLLLGRDVKSDPLLAKGLAHVLSIPPAWDDSGVTDLYSWMSATEAAFLAGGDVWAKWRKGIRDALVPAQQKSGAKSGSWDPADPWAPDGGRIYSTAAAVLCLEEHNGYLPPLPKDPTRDGRGLRAARALESAAKDASNHETVREAARAALAVWRGP